MYNYFEQNSADNSKKVIDAFMTTKENVDKYYELTREMHDAISSGNVEKCNSVLQKEVQKYKKFISNNRDFLGIVIIQCNNDEKLNELQYYIHQFEIVAKIIIYYIIYSIINKKLSDCVIEEFINKYIL